MHTHTHLWILIQVYFSTAETRNCGCKKGHKEESPLCTTNLKIVYHNYFQNMSTYNLKQMFWMKK